MVCRENAAAAEKTVLRGELALNRDLPWEEEQGQSNCSLLVLIQ